MTRGSRAVEAQNPYAKYIGKASPRVAHLHNPDDMSWNEEVVDVMFSRDDAVDVKQIAIGGPEIDDFLAWNFMWNGVFSVKSAYHLRMSMNRARTGQPESLSSVAKHKGYLALW